MRGDHRLQGGRRSGRLLRGQQGLRPQLSRHLQDVPDGEGPGRLDRFKEGVLEEGQHAGGPEEGVAFHVDMSKIPFSHAGF